MEAPEFADYFTPEGTLRHDKVEDLLVEVCSGKYIFEGPGESYTLYASRSPTHREQDTARILYTTRLHEAKARGLRTRSELEEVGLSTGLLSAEDREEREGIIRQLERYRKVRDRTPSLQQRLEIEADTEKSHRRLIEIERKENVLLQHSAESHAEDVRINYYVAACTLGGRMLESPVWPTYDDYEGQVDSVLALVARHAYFRVTVGLPTRLIRAVARSNEWRSKWQAINESGAPAFEGTPSAWDRNKLNLIYWSKFYDNILGHPEAPDENIINDDEALNNWVSQQIAKRGATKPVGVSNRPSPTYMQNGVRKKMTKLGSDRVIQVNQPYRLRTGAQGE